MTFLKGVRAGTSIAIGYLPVALTFGLLAKTGGLSLIEATAMSLLVFAGAAQYISLSLIAKSVDPVLIVLNTFVVNIRHFLMTASLNEKMQSDARWKKGLYAFGVTDETFTVLATQKESKVPTVFAVGVILISYSSWVGFTALGHLIGDILPSFLQAAMGIALYAMFVGLLVPSMKGNRKIVLLAITAAVVHMFLYFTSLLSTGWAILFSTLFSSIFVEVIYSKVEKKKEVAQ